MEQNKQDVPVSSKLPWYSYFILIFGIIIFAGIFDGPNSPVKALGFSNLLGEFGVMGTLEEGGESVVTFAQDFKGIGGFGIKDGFLLGLTVAPSMILAFAFVQILTDFGAIQAAQKLFSKITRPLLGLPGSSSLPIVSNLTTVDSSAVLTKELYEQKKITYKELIILNVFLFAAPSTVVNWYMFPGQLRQYMTEPFMLGLAVVLVFKFIGVLLCRVFLKLSEKKGKGVIDNG